MSFTVITDTSANLPSRIVRQKKLLVLPFHYFVEGKSFTCLDTESFNGDDYYAKIKNGMRVTTSQVPPQQYMDYFEPILREGRDVLVVSMSSGISGSCGSAEVAARQLMEEYPDRRVRVVDTRGASLGEGLVALKAVELQEQGMDIDEAIPILEDYCCRMFQVFTVDNLMHLRRSGRLSNLSAIVGTVLHIKPLLKGNDEGKIVAFAKICGRQRSVEALAERYDQLVKDPENQTVGIAQAGCREDADYLEKLIRKNRPPRAILNVEYEPVTGSHVGPGALALFFLGGKNVRSEV